jgi:hypothetical protein
MRPLSPGPFPVQFLIDAGEGGISRGRGTAPDWIEVRGPDGERARATRWRPLWFGWGRFVRPIGSGTVLRYEIRGPHGELLESAFAKLDLDPPGKVDSIVAETVPHRIYVRASRSGGGAASAMPFEVAVYRGKLLMATATLAVGETLPFEGHLLALPEWRPWVQLELVSDPGIPLALAGGLLAAVGLALRGIASRRSRRDGGGYAEGRPT